MKTKSYGLREKDVRGQIKLFKNEMEIRTYTFVHKKMREKQFEEINDIIKRSSRYSNDYNLFEIRITLMPIF